MMAPCMASMIVRQHILKVMLLKVAGWFVERSTDCFCCYRRDLHVQGGYALRFSTVGEKVSQHTFLVVWHPVFVVACMTLVHEVSEKMVLLI